MTSKLLRDMMNQIDRVDISVNRPEQYAWRKERAQLFQLQENATAIGIVLGIAEALKAEGHDVQVNSWVEKNLLTGLDFDHVLIDGKKIGDVWRETYAKEFRAAQGWED